MTFEFPLGLLGLIGVPIVILIYILKNKHTEQIISSTYLWELSEKFLNKKKPISLLSGIISLILQIFAIISLSLLIAHPIITIPNQAKEYCFILDASGSMNMKNENGVARIELAKNNIINTINESYDGSLYTLVYASLDSRVVYEKISDKEKAIELLGNLNATGASVSYNSILEYVQKYFNDYNSLEVMLFTDKDYESSNIEIINLSNNEENYAVVDLNIEDNNALGSIISYESDSNIELELYIDDELVESKAIYVKKLEEADYSFKIENNNYSSIRVNIKNEDGLSLDNSLTKFNLELQNSYKALIISDNPFYLESAINSLGSYIVDVIPTDNYSQTINGYSLYIFDSYNPDTLPSDGTVWLFGVDESVDEAGFSVQDVVEDEEGILMKYPKNSSSMFKQLTNGLLMDDIYVTKYVKYGIYKNFTTLLTHDGNPIIFTGVADNGVREVVFAFDLHNSNLGLLPDYLTLINNLIDYSFPTILEEVSYVSGDKVRVNILSNCDSIRVESPSNNVSYLNVSSEIDEFIVDEVGTYKLTMMFGQEKKEFNIFVSLPNEESLTDSEAVELNLQGEKGNDFSDGIYEKLIIIFVLLAIVFVADWMVYCYEQYQLR